MAKETAEKKLLKLIESTQAQEAAAGGQPALPAAPAPVVENEAQKVLESVQSVGIKFSLPSFFSQIPAIFKGGAPAMAAPGSFGLKDLNKVLALGIVVVAGFLVLSFLSGWNQVNKGLTFSVEAAPVNTDSFMPQFRELQEYVSTISRRNIFQPYEVKVVETESGGVAVAESPINERAKALKLVGISWLDTPESASAMIENTESGVTYFLKSGEQINNVTIKEIFADSIVVSFGTEEMEMRL